MKIALLENAHDSPISVEGQTHLSQQTFGPNLEDALVTTTPKIPHIGTLCEFQVRFPLLGIKANPGLS